MIYQRLICKRIEFLTKLSYAAMLVLLACFSSLSFAQNLETGQNLFKTYCESCHGPNGDGNGPAAVDFVLKPRDFALAAYKFDTDANWERGTDKDLADVISQGPAAFGGSPLMPAWRQFTQDELDLLVDYIRTLEKSPRQ